ARSRAPSIRRPRDAGRTCARHRRPRSPFVDHRLAPVAANEYLDLRLGEFLDRLTTAGPGPGGGSAAALTVSFAAGLVAMVARRSADSWPEARVVAAQARALLSRTATHARASAEGWHAATVSSH